MVNRYSLTLLLLVLCLSLTGLNFRPAHAQTGKKGPVDQSKEPKSVIRAEVNLVNVIFTVSKDGRFVSNLTKDDFEVYEDGVKQRIDYFANYSSEDALPLTIAMLVDTSGSEKFKLDVEKETAGEFFQKILRPQKDIACLIQFDSEVNLVHDFTGDSKALIRALETLRAGNSTALYDAIYLAVTEKLQSETGRKVIVVISDGDDTSSKLKRSEAIEAAQKADVIIYGIGVRDPRFPDDFGTLEKFAKETGGKFFKQTAKLESLQRSFRMIGEDIKNQYSLGYVSTNKKKDGSYRRIEIKSRVKGLKLTHRRGYYAPSDRNGP